MIRPDQDEANDYRQEDEQDQEALVLNLHDAGSLVSMTQNYFECLRMVKVLGWTKAFQAVDKSFSCKKG